jgi:1,4-alpha-glucan branching enzyme
VARKTVSRDGASCRVTFELPAEAGARSVAVAGDFNDWSRQAHPLTRRKDGRFSATVTLPTGRQYHYRYWVDDERWENDWAADDYVANDFGGDDSLLVL